MHPVLTALVISVFLVCLTVVICAVVEGANARRRVHSNGSYRLARQVRAKAARPVVDPNVDPPQLERWATGPAGASPVIFTSLFSTSSFNPGTISAKRSSNTRAVS